MQMFQGQNIILASENLSQVQINNNNIIFLLAQCMTVFTNNPQHNVIITHKSYLVMHTIRWPGTLNFV